MSDRIVESGKLFITHDLPLIPPVHVRLPNISKPNYAHALPFGIILDMSKRQVQATIYGRVQGVSFRYYTQKEAVKLGVTGWVANQWDGSVRTIAEGEEETLQQFVQFLQTGSPYAHVDHVALTWAKASETFKQFEIRHL